MRRRTLLAGVASAVTVGVGAYLARREHAPDARLVGPREYDPRTPLGTDTVGDGEQHPTVVVGDRAHVEQPDASRRRTVLLRTSPAGRDLDLVVRADGTRIFEYEARYGPRDWQLLGFLEPADYELVLEASTGHASTGLSNRYVPTGADAVTVSVGPLAPEVTTQYVTLDADAFADRLTPDSSA